MDRNIVLLASDLAVISTILAVFFCVFIGSIVSFYLQHKKKNLSIAPSPKKIIIFFSGSLSLIASLIVLTTLKFGHTEKSEWIIYEISAFLTFFLALLVSRRKFKINENLQKISLLFFYFAISILVIFLTIYFKRTSFIFLSGLLLNFGLFRKSKYYLTSLLFSLSSIFCVIGFFILNFITFTFTELSLIILFWIVLSIFIVYPVKIRIHSLVSGIFEKLSWLSLLILGFSPVQRLIDTHHYSFYLGPAYEISQGKSLLSDIPSQYGYLSIHFTNSILQIFNRGITFDSFLLFHTFLLLFYFIGFYLAYRFLIKNRLLILLFSAVTFLLQTCFLQYRGLNLPPSTGPMRFIFGLLIVLSLWYIPKRKFKIITTCLLGAIATFWSIETAIYIVPALCFMLSLDAYLQAGVSTKSFQIFIKNLGLYIFTSLSIFLVIILKEYSYHHASPDLRSFYQFANIYKDGYGSLLVPIFGNHYLAVGILLLGLFYTFYFINIQAQKNIVFSQIKKQKQHWIIIGLAFLAIHNIAIFSYFVSRSASQNILNIGPFLLLELTILLIYLCKKKYFFHYYLLPSTLFLILFFYSCFVNIFRGDKPLDSSLQYRAAQTEYDALVDSHTIQSNNVLVLSYSYDTLLITQNKLHTTLPLNPVAMTSILPNFESRYIQPNLDKIPDGTILIYSNDSSTVFTTLSKYFSLDPIKTASISGVFSLFRMTHIK